LFYSLARYGAGEEARGSLEALTVLAGLAAVTERVHLGSLVLCAPFRHPAIVAKMATVIQQLSKGRFELGIGAGWYGAEFEAFGFPFGSTRERFAMLEEYAEVLHLLFREGPASFDGESFTLREAHNRPLPDPPPPVWLGGKGGDRLLRLVARRADGWNTVWRWSVEDYAEHVRRAREIFEEEGRDPAGLRLSIGLYTIVGEDEGDLAACYRSMQGWMPGRALDGESLEDFSRDTLTGTPSQVLDRLHGLAELGVEEVILAPAPLPFSVPDPGMLDVIAGSVIPAARTL
jgi:alkanesulfonate monooxygenase SsuD/methylene tetrahydromethanopterin reductase-like flavin-dependent oxidoreductase (luciferase family)